MFFFKLYLQVWFQNKRSKERRLKQLTSMGRGPFFGGSRKMRGFPMNLSPGGLDDGPGFPYFTGDKFDFGYGGPPFHPHDSPFFPGHPGGPGMPFNAPGNNKLPFNFDVYGTNISIIQQGGPMDHAGPIPMVNDFGGMTPEANFLNQPNGPPGSNGGSGPDIMAASTGGARSGSPEFMNTGNFSEASNMQNEGLVW